jgi:hypothetical protein
VSERPFGVESRSGMTKSSSGQERFSVLGSHRKVRFGESAHITDGTGHEPPIRASVSISPSLLHLILNGIEAMSISGERPQEPASRMERSENSEIDFDPKSREPTLTLSVLPIRRPRPVNQPFHRRRSSWAAIARIAGGGPLRADF